LTVFAASDIRVGHRILPSFLYQSPEEPEYSVVLLFVCRPSLSGGRKKRLLYTKVCAILNFWPERQEPSLEGNGELA
jgi:hypothetical protein